MTGTALPASRRVTIAMSSMQVRAGETTPVLMTWVAERPMPTMTRWPTLRGRAAAYTSRQSVAVVPPPSMRSSPRRVGHAPSRPRTTPVVAMTRDEMSSTRTAVVRVRLTTASRGRSSEPATVLRITAPIPRSVKGMREGKVARSPFWA